MFPHPLASLLAPFRGAFTGPTWQRVVQLLEGTLLTHGRRTVTAALRAVGLQEERPFNLFPHVLSRAGWSSRRISRALWLLLVQTCVPKGAPVEIVADETVERRWGPPMTKGGDSHDPVRSSEKQKRISRGFCVALLAAHRHPCLGEPTLGTSFSLCLVDFRGGRYEVRTPAYNRSRVDKTACEGDPPMASR